MMVFFKSSELCTTAACMSVSFPCRVVHNSVCACMLMAALPAAMLCAGPLGLLCGGWQCVLDVTVVLRSMHNAGWQLRFLVLWCSMHVMLWVGPTSVLRSCLASTQSITRSVHGCTAACFRQGMVLRCLVCHML